MNMFNMVFAANDAMKGKYFGYNGPCPPWNDDTVHHYHFFVYALSVKSLGLPADLTARRRWKQSKARCWPKVN